MTAHVAEPNTTLDGWRCEECYGKWPCATVTAREETLAELRGKVEALPEVLEVALGYSVVARAAVLALLSPDTGAPESTHKEKE